MNYYKQKYAIGVYKKIRKEGDTDELVYLFDSPLQFANFLGRSLHKIYDILGSHINKGRSDIYFKGNVYELHLIDMLED